MNSRTTLACTHNIHSHMLNSLFPYPLSFTTGCCTVVGCMCVEGVFVLHIYILECSFLEAIKLLLIYPLQLDNFSYLHRILAHITHLHYNTIHSIVLVIKHIILCRLEQQHTSITRHFICITAISDEIFYQCQ